MPRLSLRLILSTDAEESETAPAVPGLLRQIATECGLRVGGWRADADPWRIRSQEDLDRLIAMLEARDRHLPVYVASGDERTETPDQPLIDAAALARATLGLAHVVIVPAQATHPLSEAFGKVRAVYHGAVRVYLPGFDSASDPYDHRLLLAERIRLDPASCMRELRRLAATESLRRRRLGHDVMPFAAARSVALRIEQEAGAKAGASEAAQLAAAQKRVAALEAELASSRAQAGESFDLAHQEEERAKVAEARLRGALARIDQLSGALKERGQDPDQDRPVPQTWDEFIDWCDEVLAGRVVLAPVARNGIKKPAFADVALGSGPVKYFVSARSGVIHGLAEVHHAHAALSADACAVAPDGAAFPAVAWRAAR